MLVAPLSWGNLYRQSGRLYCLPGRLTTHSYLRASKIYARGNLWNEVLVQGGAYLAQLKLCRSRDEALGEQESRVSHCNALPSDDYMLFDIALTAQWLYHGFFCTFPRSKLQHHSIRRILDPTNRRMAR